MSVMSDFKKLAGKHWEERALHEFNAANNCCCNMPRALAERHLRTDLALARS